jgi:hypothetical protein
VGGVCLYYPLRGENFVEIAIEVYLSTFSGAVAFSTGRRAVAGLRQFAVRPDAGLSVDAPEQTFIRVRDGWVGLGKNELGFPAESRAQVRVIGVKAIRFRDR